ncbi:hypothetical protein F5Y17DRAFT_199306 [Xylariaceae sp. FL0594]|nr:hypothetical protein F5Y17DRAFT_199306 [Xylariaceae sp. FL0594]
MAANVQQPLVCSKRKRADTTSSEGPSAMNSKRSCLTDSLHPVSGVDLETLDAVDARYHVRLHSVISSSKIQNRVSAVLRHLTLTPTSPSTKRNISVLRAKAYDVNKLVSIAEIAKREIEKEKRTTIDGSGNEGAGTWFQYIVLGEEMQQSNRCEGSTVIYDTVIGSIDPGQEEPEQNTEFEVMKTPFQRAVKGRSILRGLPVMSLFLSRSRIEELKKRYGEQSNT